MEDKFTIKSKTPYIVVPRWWIQRETAEHPEYFEIHDDEDRTMTWCGYVVYTILDRYGE